MNEVIIKITDCDDCENSNFTVQCCLLNRDMVYDGKTGKFPIPDDCPRLDKNKKL